MGKKQANKMS